MIEKPQIPDFIKDWFVELPTDVPEEVLHLIQDQITYIEQLEQIIRRKSEQQ